MSNPDSPDREGNATENPVTMGGAIGGATGAGAVAGLGLAVLGPLGGVLGVLAGAVGGWWAGEGVVKAVREVDHHDDHFRDAHLHAGDTRPYEEVRHGYQLGFLAGRNPRNADSTFLDVEDDLREAWIQAHQHDTDSIAWDQVRSSAMSGYELARES